MSSSPRMHKDEFYTKIASLDIDHLKKLLWELYWRGGKDLRGRIETLLNPQRPKKRGPELPDGDLLLQDVLDFVALARSGAYMGGSREVSRNERSKWRVTFRKLVKDASLLLAHGEMEYGAPAMEDLIDLACKTKGVMYFHSEDPVAAMRLVVSDQAQLLWGAYLVRAGFATFAKRAVFQFIRWESPYVWTTYGEGWVKERETTLTSILVQMLKGHDAWVEFTDAYLAALDHFARPVAPSGGRKKPSRWDDRNRELAAERRGENLAEWNELVLEHLQGTDADDRLDRLVHHPAIGGAEERKFLQAKLAYLRGDQEQARQLLKKCLQARPGYRRYLTFADEIGLVLKDS